MLSFEITTEEYEKEIQEILQQFESEIINPLKSLEKIHIEVVGKNIQNFHIKRLMESVKYKESLDASESAARGASMALKLATSDMKYKVAEVSSYKIFVNKENPTVIVEAGEKIGEEKTLELEEGEHKMYEEKLCANSQSIVKEIGCIKIKKINNEKLKLKINQFGLPDASNDPNMEIIFNSQLSENELNKLHEEEIRFQTLEKNYFMAGEIRNSTESLLDGLEDWLRSNCPTIESEVISQMNDAIDEYFDTPMTTDYEVESRNRQIVVDKMKKVEESVVKVGQEAEKILKEAHETVKKLLIKVKIPTMSSPKLSGMNRKILEQTERIS